ncbi:50S ribosomal protein L25/general stress protein Ctc [Haloechinothrix sp. LS1_15]|uniref:50S ribosomal protein L25/general stress protein Ctc n=1 Tax=Haloechinothrix sp. LS1_15 TaxID=2652248 RepID=UPI00294719F8|nr:50S ribosomal protein L25/general stress protein Ctc [Haloechinothrix sp. LS1_15]MDV6011483.1 50S ribosomal protein L25/general stress protein Ctc [Haloechinothrix sp. LS1_15]
MSEVRLTAEPRTEFGKGAARRFRRDGKIPAVLYGHGSEPKHLALPTIEFARVIRENGRNAVLSLNVDGSRRQLALTKSITVHPLKNYIQHVDLLALKRGEKVTVDVPLHLTGDAANATLIYQDLDTLSVEVDALHIPEYIEVTVDGLEAGTQITAADVPVPDEVTLLTDPEALVVAVNEAPTAESMEAEADTEGAGVVEEPSDEEQASGGGSGEQE